MVAIVHWLLGRNGGRNAWLLLTSIVFYAAWNPYDTLLLAFIVALSYGGARWIEGRPEERRTWPLALVSICLIAPLLYYKYLHFAAESLHLLIPSLPVPPRLRLPIGISFYSFQAVAYVVDVRRGQKAEKNPLLFSTFLLFFPHLVAGPILRASVLLSQLGSNRSLSSQDIGEGIFRLCMGLIKKLLIADVLRIGMVDSVFADPSVFTPIEILVALYAYTLQIYCDFSGYTDFAIGSARLLGFKIPENFDRPYQALSVGEYWRRWHITLSDWVRDYVYYPMGGSRIGGWKAYRNTFLTMLILAVWHGANWTFVLYGLLHGCAVSLHRLMHNLQKSSGQKPQLSAFGIGWRWFATFHFVVLARILFRATSITHAAEVATGLLQSWEWVMPRYAYHAWAVFFIGYAIHLSPRPWVQQLRTRFAALPSPIQGILLAGVGAACIRWGPGDSLSFIYYEF